MARPVTVAMLLSGMPWSATWVSYLTWVRNHWSVTAGTPDWPVGAHQPTARLTMSGPALASHSTMPGMTASEMAAMSPAAEPANQSKPISGPDLRALDKVMPVAARLHVPRPVWISPPFPALAIGRCHRRYRIGLCA